MYQKMRRRHLEPANTLHAGSEVRSSRFSVGPFHSTDKLKLEHRTISHTVMAVWSSRFGVFAVSSQLRIVPATPVTQDRVLVPQGQCPGTAGFLDPVPRAGEWPLVPVGNIAVMDGVVVNVVQRRPEMTVGAQRTLGAVAPNLASARTIDTVPVPGRPPVKTTEAAERTKNVRRLDEAMVMVGQHAPTANRRTTAQRVEERCLELSQSRQIGANERLMFVTGGGHVVVDRVAGTMGRSMPWLAA